MSIQKKILPLAIAALLPLAAQAEGPIDGTIYGKINLTVESQDTIDYDGVKLETNNSRLGFKGKTGLNDSLFVIYQLEYQVDPNGDVGTFSQRNSYVGLAGGFGSLIAGIHDTPTKLLQNKVDLFNDLKGDIKNVISDSDNRAKNTVMYATPEMGGFFAQAAYVASENENNDDGASVAIGWQNDTIYGGISYDDGVDLNHSVVRGVVQATLGSFQLGALVESDDNDNTGETAEGWMLSAQYKMGSWALKVQAGQSDIVEQGGETVSVGADYKLAKNTKVFGFYTQDTADDDVLDDQYLAVGIEHKF